MGMENGYPLGNDLGLLDTFYGRGIRYITIVHSYTNDICDSSTDSAEYGGLSPFGEKVVGRMNELGHPGGSFPCFRRNRSGCALTEQGSGYSPPIPVQGHCVTIPATSPTSCF